LVNGWVERRDGLSVRGTAFHHLDRNDDDWFHVRGAREREIKANIAHSTVAAQHRKEVVSVSASKIWCALHGRNMPARFHARGITINHLVSLTGTDTN